MLDVCGIMAGPPVAAHGGMFGSQRHNYICSAFVVALLGCSSGESGQSSGITPVETATTDAHASTASTNTPPRSQSSDSSNAAETPSDSAASRVPEGEEPANDTPASSSKDAQSDGAQSGDKPSEAPPADSSDSPAMPADEPSTPETKPEEPRADGSQPSAAIDWDKDCDIRHNFHAHGNEVPDDDTPYQIPAGDEQLRRFVFVPDWPDGLHMIAARRTGENTRAMHHWGFYTVGNITTAADGDIIDSHDFADSLQTQGPGLLIGGGPGTPALQLPPGVGAVLPVGGSAGLALEVHYFNASEETALDDFGVELCLTSKPVMEEAAIHVLGSEGFTLPAKRETDITSTCRPLNQKEPVHVFAVTPHMHARGVHSKIVLTRASGEQVMLIDEPYGFEDQRTYPLPDIVVEPGDTLTSTCGYDNMTDHAIVEGASVDDEMCFMLMWAWPTGILQNGLPFGGSMAVAEDKDCVGVVL